MPDYQKGKVYKIICNVTGKCYIGSTTEPTLARRLSKHVNNYKDYLAGSFGYVSSFEILQNNSYYIYLHENWPCQSKDELFARERYWSNQLECVNKIKNQGLLLQLGKNEYKKNYRKSAKYIDTTKRYNLKNIEIIKKQHKNYRLENADKIKQKFQCLCGSVCRIIDKARHNKTKKHQKYLQEEKFKQGIIKCCTLEELKQFMNL